MDREVTILVFLAIILVLTLFLFGRLILRIYFDREEKKIKIAKKNKLKQLSEERLEMAKQIESESDHR